MVENESVPMKGCLRSKLCSLGQMARYALVFISFDYSSCSKYSCRRSNSKVAKVF
jgi:hypothetical protein